MTLQEFIDALVRAAAKEASYLPWLTWHKPSVLLAICEVTRE